MKLKEFFNSESVSLPKGGFDDGKKTFDLFLEELLEDYIKQLRLIEDLELLGTKSSAKENLVATAQALKDSILKSLRTYLNGHVHLAYQEFSAGLSGIDWTPLRSELVKSSNAICLQDDFSPHRYEIDHPPLYRIRSDRSQFENPKRSDIFHVPFEKRRLVSNQRYSIAGLPCLYLGSSLWICWEELGRPALDSLWVSRFRIESNVTVLDFQFTPHQVWRMFEDLREAKPKALDRSSAEKLKAHFNLDFLKSYASCWPLIAACSVRREQRVGSFAPEFVVPQLLLQWVAQENGFDGLRYFSVWTPTRGMHLFGHSNCVFPVKKVSFKGHCPELTKAFAFTAPISWEALTAVDLGSSSFITNEDSNASAQIQLNSDLPDFEYFRTTFFTTELKLKDVEARPNCSRIMDV